MKKILLISVALYFSIAKNFAQTNGGEYLANKHYFRIEYIDITVQMKGVYALVNHRENDEIINYYKNKYNSNSDVVDAKHIVYLFTYGYSGWNDNFPIEFFIYQLPRIKFIGYEGDTYFFSKNDYYQFNSDSDSLSFDGIDVGIKIPWYINFANGKWFYQPLNIKLHLLFTRWHTRGGDKIYGPNLDFDLFSAMNVALPIVGYRFNKNIELYGGLSILNTANYGRVGNNIVLSGKYPCECQKNNKDIIESAKFKASLNSVGNSLIQVSAFNFFLGMGYRF